MFLPKPTIYFHLILYYKHFIICIGLTQKNAELLKSQIVSVPFIQGFFLLLLSDSILTAEIIFCLMILLASSCIVSQKEQVMMTWLPVLMLRHPTSMTVSPCQKMTKEREKKR